MCPIGRIQIRLCLPGVLVALAGLFLVLEIRLLREAVAWDLARLFGSTTPTGLHPAIWLLPLALSACTSALGAVVLAGRTKRLAWIGFVAVACCLLAAAALVGVLSWLCS
jgi:hypothetical protein